MTIVNYVHSCPFGPYKIPISIQSVFLRDYCNKLNLPFSLPLTEYCLSGSYFSLFNHIRDLSLDSLIIICPSIYIFSNLDRLSPLFILLMDHHVIIHCVLEKHVSDIMVFKISRSLPVIRLLSF